jgi:hypothetical protein
MAAPRRADHFFLLAGREFEFRPPEHGQGLAPDQPVVPSPAGFGHLVVPGLVMGFNKSRQVSAGQNLEISRFSIFSIVPKNYLTGGFHCFILSSFLRNEL